MDLQQPPDEELQLMEVLQKFQEQHSQTVHHQVPLIFQIYKQKEFRIDANCSLKDKQQKET